MRAERLMGLWLTLGVVVPKAVAQTGTWKPETATWKPSGTKLESSVVFGDPEKTGVYTIAFRLAPGAWIPPHSHPRPKQVIVLTGTLKMGFGAKLDSAKVDLVTAGQVHVVPLNTVHYEGASVPTVVLFSGEGPLVTNWVIAPTPASQRGMRLSR